MMTPTDAEYLAAMRADAIPEGSKGLWNLIKQELKEPLSDPKTGDVCPAGNYTCLLRYTTETLMCGGESVMNDFPCELLTHLDFAKSAHGKVLVTGLGLGCVVRGLLLNPAVERIDVVERDKDVIALVMPHMPMGFGLHHADARHFARTTRLTFDCAWHDVWSDPDKNEPHLTVIHNQMMISLRNKVPKQGAWAMDKRIKALWQSKHLTEWIGS
jgi:hypothetical protein